MTRLRRAGLAVVGWLATLFFSGSADAGVLYGTDSGGALIRIDTATGAGTVVGRMGITGLGMAVHGTTGVAYTRDFNNLYTVNLQTAARSLVGPSGTFITGLAFDQGFTTLYSVNQGNGQFFRVNPATGDATFVGSTGLSSPLDLSTNSAGVLHVATIDASIYTINQATGAATLVRSRVDPRGLTAISFDENDVLYGVTQSADRLVRIDLVSGTTTTVGGPLPGTDIRGLDFDRFAAVPEPSSLVLLGVTALGFLGHRWRRRTKALA